MISVEDSEPYKTFWQVFLHDIRVNSISGRAAGIALFSIISLFPIVAILIWIVTFYNLQSRIGVVFSEVKTFVPEELVQLLTGEIQYRSQHQLSGKWYALATHLFILLLSGGSAARSLLNAFQTIGHVKTEKWLLNIFGRSILLVVSFIIFSFILCIMGGIIFVAFTYVVDAFKLSWFILPLQWIFMTVLISITINVVYRWTLLGTIHTPMSGWMGALIAAALIAIMTLVLAAYNHFDPSNSVRYGTYGAIRNVLLWLYGCSFATLIGAQINATRNGLLNSQPKKSD